MPGFNSDVYAWKDLSVVMLGRTITGIQGLTYNLSTEKELVFGSGQNPLAVKAGNKSVEGEIMLLQYEYEALDTAIKAALGPDADVTDVQLDIVASYGDGTTPKTHVVVGASFTEVPLGMEQNDKFMSITMPFIALSLRTGR